MNDGLIICILLVLMFFVIPVVTVLINDNKISRRKGGRKI